MNIKLNNFKSIFFGFIIGCVFGGSIVWWQKAYLIDRLIDKGIRFFSYSSEKGDKKLYVDTNYNYSKSPKTKITNNALINEETSDSIDTKAFANNTINNTIDSIYTDSIVKKYNNLNNYSIAKEELLFSKTLKIHNKDIKSESLNIADTIFKEDNIGDYNVSSEYNIEFWKSPINFKGYKTGKNKIILFGIYDFKKLLLKKQNDLLYLQCDDKYYIIENTDNFKPLSIIANKKTINQLADK